MFDPKEPQTGHEIAASLRAVAAQGARFLEALPAAEFFAPQGTFWSPSEHARHLRKSVRPLVLALGLPKLVLWLRFGRSRGSRSFPAMRGVYLAALSGGATVSLVASQSNALAAGGPLHCPNTGGAQAVLACRNWCLAQCTTRTCLADCVDLNCTCP